MTVYHTRKIIKPKGYTSQSHQTRGF